jgi:uncharacterized membrane protein YkvA (DUF1232 family)
MGWLSDSAAPALKRAKPSSKTEATADFPLELRGKSWKEQGQILRNEVQVLWLILQDRRTPWYAKLLVASAVGYVFSPIQLIPSFIPVIGFLDDFLALAAGFKLAHWLAPETVIRDARWRARTLARERDEQVPTLASRAGIVVVAAIWLMLMAVGMIWMYKI